MASAPHSPYVGPRPFERTAEDRARFFGRDREVEEIVSLILSHPIVLVYAQSGAGKTSLVNTAVSEALDDKGVALLPLTRVRGDTGPGLDAAAIPNLYVFSALQSLAPDAARDELAGFTLAAYLEGSRPEGEPRPRTLVLDQFEELFTSETVYELYGDGWQEQQRGFFVQVADAIAADPLLRVVLVMRKEYLAELERFTPLLPERLQTRFLLEPLQRDAALAAVRGPLDGTGRSFGDGVAEALVDRLLTMRVGPDRDVHGRFVEPVQLQLVCRSLWQDLPADATTITESEVQAFGDVDTVLGQFYERAVHAAAAAGREREARLRARIESDFITSIGTRGAVYLGGEWTRRSAALDELERRHLIHAEWRAGTRWYELTHDRLIDPIRSSNERFRGRRLRRRAFTGGALAALAAIAGAAFFVVTLVVGPRGIQTSNAPGVLTSHASGLLRETLTDSHHPIVAATAIGDGNRMASITDSGTLQVTPLDGSSQQWFEVGGDVRTAAFSPDGSVAFVVHDDGRVVGWELATGTSIGEVPLGGRQASAIAFSPSGQFAAIATGDEVQIFDVSARRFVKQRRFDATVRSVAFDPVGRRRFAVGLASGAIALAPFTGRIHEVRGTGGAVDAVAFDHRGAKLIVAARESVTILAVRGLKRLTGLNGNAGPIRAVGFSPDDSRIVTGTDGGYAFVERLAPLFISRDPTRPFHPIVLSGHGGRVRSATFTPDGNQVVTLSADGTMRVWGFFGTGATLRERIVDCALAGVGNQAKIHYSEIRPMEGIVRAIRLPRVPMQMDTSGFVTWCYWQAGAPDPNGLHYDGAGFTGTLLNHMRHIPQRAVRPGDLVVWGSGTGQHAALVVKAGKDPLLASHGSESGPRLVSFSAENGWFRKHAVGTVTWLTEALG